MNPSSTTRPARSPVTTDHEAARDDTSDLTRWCLTTAIGSIVCALWLVRLPRSFLVDETITGWITADGLGDAWERGWNHQGNGPLYFCLLWFWRQAVGSSEIALRAPSVLAMVAATVIVYRLGVEFRDRLTGLIAAFAFATTAEIVVRATTARPYGLQILFVTVSTAALVRWSTQGRTRDAVAWALAAVAAVYMHPFAGLIVVVHAIYLWSARRGGQDVPLDRLARPAALGMVLSTPIVPHMVDVAGRSGSLVISDVPPPDRFVGVLVPAALVGATAIGALAARSWTPSIDPGRPRHALVLAWALVPTSIMYVVSILGRPILVGRYFAFTAAGTAIAAALVLAGFATPIGRRVALVSFVVLSLFVVSDLNGVVRQDWREAVEWGETVVGDEDAVVLVNSALIETTDVSLLDRNGWRDYLAAPYGHYGTGRTAFPLPLSLSEAGVDHLDRLLRAVTVNTDAIILVARTDEVAEADYPAEITRRLTSTGWSARTGPDLARVEVVVYTR